MAIFTEAITAGTIMGAASDIRDASAGLFFDDMKIIAGEQTRLIGRSKAG